MIQRKKKKCIDCGELTYIWAHKRCKRCDMLFKEKSRSEGLKIGNKTMYSWDKYKKRKTTGELKLFMQIYAERKGICQITGKFLPFDVSNFAHILSKGAYGKFRLNPDNIIMVDPDIHRLYDNDNKDNLLKKYPKAIMIYDLKEELKRKYHDSKRTGYD